MGGRGSSSGIKKSSGTKSPTYTPSKTPLSKMSDTQLKNELFKMATAYYASGKSGISFGGRSPEQVASTLLSQKRSRHMLEKDYKSFKKRMG